MLLFWHSFFWKKAIAKELRLVSSLPCLLGWRELALRPHHTKLPMNKEQFGTNKTRPVNKTKKKEKKEASVLFILPFTGCSGVIFLSGFLCFYQSTGRAGV